LLKGVPTVKSPKGHFYVTFRLPLSHLKVTFSAYPFCRTPFGGSNNLLACSNYLFATELACLPSVPGSAALGWAQGWEETQVICQRTCILGLSLFALQLYHIYIYIYTHMVQLRESGAWDKRKGTLGSEKHQADRRCHQWLRWGVVVTAGHVFASARLPLGGRPSIRGSAKEVVWLSCWTKWLRNRSLLES